MKLAAYRHIIHPDVDPICPSCLSAPQTVDHWLLHCPTITPQRLRILDEEDLSLALMTTAPLKVIRLARCTL